MGIAADRVRRAEWVIGLVGASCLAAALLAQAGRVFPPLDALSNFAPFWLIGSVSAGLGGLAAARGNRRWVLLGLGLAGAVVAANMLLPEFTRPIAGAGADGSRLKVIVFNAWDRNPDESGTAAWIAGERPDLVLMQETEPAIEQALVARGFNMVQTMAHTAVFSRQRPIRPAYVVPMGLWPRLPDLTRATFAFGGGTFNVVSLHMDRHFGDADSQDISALAQLAALYPSDTLIVAGDFNTTPWSLAMRRLDRALPLQRRDRALATWPARLPMLGGAPAPLPFLAIDHLYAGSAWRTISVARGPRSGSDHYPLIVTLSMPPTR